MKKLVSIAVLFSFLVMAGCIQNQKATAVATVNGIEISSVDFDNTLEQTIKIVQAQNPQSLQKPFAKDILGKKILQDMIIKEVFLQQAKKANIETTKEEIDNVVSKVKEQFKVNKEGKELTPQEKDSALNNAIKEQGLTKEKYLSNVSDNIIIEKYRRKLISENLKPVSEEDTKIFFNNISAIYNNDSKKIEELKKTPARYEEAAVIANQLKSALAPKAQFDLILVYADNNMTKEELEQRKQTANKIRKEIKDKSNFADVAKEYSQQKDARIFFSRMNVFEGMQPEELSSRAFKLKVGEVSNVFEIFKDKTAPNTAQGYFIMNVVEKIAGQKFTYETFEKQLENYINTKRAESIISQSVKNFMQQADIKIIKNFEMDNISQSSQTTAQ